MQSSLLSKFIDSKIASFKPLSRSGRQGITKRFISKKKYKCSLLILRFDSLKKISQTAGANYGTLRIWKSQDYTFQRLIIENLREFFVWFFNEIMIINKHYSSQFHQWTEFGDPLSFEMSYWSELLKITLLRILLKKIPSKLTKYCGLLFHIIKNDEILNPFISEAKYVKYDQVKAWLATWLIHEILHKELPPELQEIQKALRLLTEDFRAYQHVDGTMGIWWPMDWRWEISRIVVDDPEFRMKLDRLFEELNENN